MTKRQDNQFVPDYASVPGSTLLEVVESRGMSQAELAERTGRSKKHINEIIKGKQPITPETALQLERVLGVSAGFWNNRQREYEEALARAAERNRLSKHTGWVKNFPYRDMVKLGWVKDTLDETERLTCLLSYFGVAGVPEWEARWSLVRADFRKSRAFKCSRYAVAAWLRAGERTAISVETRPYDETEFRAALKAIRATTEKDVATFVPQVKSLCAKAGVALAFVPELVGTHTYGATQWLTSDKALIQLSLRGKTDDHLWFAFFHEAGHIIKHGKKDKFIEATGEMKTSDARESEADRFACDLLIPPAQYAAFVSIGDFTERAVRAFARKTGVAPGIVVGRLQHENKIPHSHHNALKRRLKWAEPEPAAC
jgi:addiction module HigA family antidote